MTEWMMTEPCREDLCRDCPGGSFGPSLQPPNIQVFRECACDCHLLGQPDEEE